MALSRCTECETIEGAWREPTDEEMKAEGMDPADSNDIEALVCGECETMGSYQGIPEHDWNEER